MSPVPPNERGETRIRTVPGQQPKSARALPAGTRVAEFEILDLIGEGGFGIVYLAQDHSLERRVALKEYMPSTLATRTSGGTTVSVRSESDAETFDLGLRSFVNEAKLLAQFDHPALVKVHRFWEANSTAYMVMPYYEGRTLARTLAERHERPDEPYLRGLLEPLLNGLTVLHAAKCYHRDVSPDNILLAPSGPLLLDFGAARKVITGASQMLTVILKEGYAPIEQYGTSETMRQGPWTDIYALCGVIRFAITAKKPPTAVDRVMSDRMEPLLQAAAGEYSESFLRAIDAGMAIKPDDRPQSIAAFRTLLAPAGPMRSASVEATQVRPRDPAQPSPQTAPTRPIEPSAPSVSGRPPTLAPPAEESRTLASKVTIAVVAIVLIGAVLLLVAHYRSPSQPAGSAAAPRQVERTPEPRDQSTSHEAPPTDQKAQEAAAAYQSLDTVLDAARKVVSANGGAPDLVLAQAEASRREGQNALASRDWTQALAVSRRSTDEAKAAARAFLDELVRNYALTAQKKMRENDLEVAEQAIRKGRAVEKLKTQFQ